MDGNQEKIDIAVLQKQMEWLTPIIERTEKKLDVLLESHWKLYGKMIGACLAISITASLLVAWIRG